MKKGPSTTANDLHPTSFADDISAPPGPVSQRDGSRARGRRLTGNDRRKISRPVAHAVFPMNFVFEEEFALRVRGFSGGKSRSASFEERVFSSRRERQDAEEFRPQPAPLGRSRPPQPTTFIPPHSPMISPLHPAQFLKETAPALAVVG